MSIINKSISEVVDSDLLEYSMYVLENRAIPSAIDGFKSGGRKLVYSMVNDYPTRKVKVSEVAGSIAKYGFHHGEASAEGAIVTLTADWNNNCPIFTGHGNFGSRLIQESAASRYIFISLSPEFKKYFIDNDITTKSLDDEAPEPQHYLPIIPWVLIPGVSGIAVGFACNILPHSIADITTALKACIRNPKRFLTEAKLITPTFPHFRGEITSESDDGKSWATHGIVEYIGKYQYKISELPVGYDREQYINVLNNLCDSDKIKDYEDNCSEEGFGFTVKVSGTQKDSIDADPEKYFKLKKSHSQNLTTMGIDGKLKIFNSIHELIFYFVEYRLQKFADKIEFEKIQCSTDIEIFKDKIKFISMVISGKIDFQKLSKTQLLQVISEKITAKEHGKGFISIPLFQCTTDAVEGLQKKISELTDQLTVLEGTTPVQRYLSVLK